MQQEVPQNNSRLPTCGQTDEDDSYPARVKQATRHGTIQLGRRHWRAIFVRNIVNAVNESGRSSSISRRIGGDFGSAAMEFAMVSNILSRARNKFGSEDWGRSSRNYLTLCVD